MAKSLLLLLLLFESARHAMLGPLRMHTQKLLAFVNTVEREVIWKQSLSRSFVESLLSEIEAEQYSSTDHVQWLDRLMPEQRFSLVDFEVVIKT